MPTKRIAVIDRNLCIRQKCGYVCMKVCPVNRMGEECIVKEKETEFPVISELLCIGCGICTRKCPVKCISIINLAKELDLPIFQYGVNTFRLYGLPLPKEGGAASLIGKNGIGKTTAIGLLANQKKPNFGKPEKEFSEEEIWENLSLEQRRYFDSIGKEIKVSMKPQYVNRIRDHYKGSVRGLIESAGASKQATEDAIAKFKLEKIADRDVQTLSGGELQKAALAAVYAKDADIYYFDEVTNYLDIEERLSVAVVLKELAERKSVMLAEHDLTILDYVSSYVYIIYGEDNVYGVVSGVKNTRAGINEYVNGFLKDENVRFRDHELEFISHSEGEVKTPVKLEYSEFHKKFPSFSFKSKKGSIRLGEVIGLVGKNALGKSLLVKMLAGVEKPDKGSPLEIKVSYKPQYIKAEDITVAEVFSSKRLSGTIFEEAKRRLRITPLMEKKLTQLSGGELQRVALTLALGTEADVYLFDEPSAFLDIEQRFEFASLLRKVISGSEKSAFVVDHDIVFVDAIANRLIVFDGESSVKGSASEPYDKRNGMNEFLKGAGITMRRDKDSHRPRINKPGSALDEQQKKSGDYYYSL